MPASNCDTRIILTNITNLIYQMIIIEYVIGDRYLKLNFAFNVEALLKQLHNIEQLKQS